MTDLNWASPPGDTIARVMANREIDASDLADALGLSNDEFDDLLSGYRRLSGKDAEILADNLGSTPRFWLARDSAYVVDSARLEEAAKPATEASWLESMPTSSMRKLGWLTQTGKAKEKLKDELLDFFGCATIQQWGARYSSGVGAVAFRTSMSLASDGMATLVWLRAGERLAADRATAKFDRAAFETLVPGLKRLAVFKSPAAILERLVPACAAAGVVVVTARTPDGCRASGASWFDPEGRPVILLSFRHLSEDHFWFTFFHEAGHVLLHGASHIDGEGATMGADTAIQEDEANAFARDVLFSDERMDDLLSGSLRPKAVIAAAKAARITPGIIVGQLEKRGTIEHGKLSFLKNRYRWSDNSYVPDLVP